MKTTLIILTLLLTGCANSQQLAQRHWSWLTQGNTGIHNTYATGVTIQNYQVNGQSFQVTAPAR